MKREVKGRLLKVVGKSSLLTRSLKFLYGKYVAPQYSIGVYAAICETHNGELRVLVQKQWDGGMSLPGGHVEYSDISLEEAAKREVLEETGLIVEIGKMLEMYKNKNSLTVLFPAQITGGELAVGDESIGFEWVSIRDLSGEWVDGKVGRNSQMFSMFQRALKK